MKTIIFLLVVLALVIAEDAAYYKTLVAIPSNAGKNQNGYTYLKTSTMLDIWGKPCTLTPDCKSVTNSNLKERIVRRTVGKFTYTGADIALDALSRAIFKLKSEKPDVYAVLGNSGMTCCRAIRGSTTSFSNHAWGFAADFNIAGVLDPRGDAKTQRGLLALFPYMKEQGFFWAAGYSGASEDSMHFEISNELMLNYAASGDWGTCTSTSGTRGRCLTTSECTTTPVTGRCPGPANIRCCLNAPAPKNVCATSAVALKATACNTAATLITIPNGESFEKIGASTTSGCGITWQKVRARKAWTGFVPAANVKACTIAVRDFANETLLFPIPTDNSTDPFPEDGDIDVGIFEESELSRTSQLTIFVGLLAAFFALF